MRTAEYALLTISICIFAIVLAYGVVGPIGQSFGRVSGLIASAQAVSVK